MWKMTGVKGLHVMYVVGAGSGTDTITNHGTLCKKENFWIKVNKKKLRK